MEILAIFSLITATLLFCLAVHVENTKASFGIMLLAGLFLLTGVGSVLYLKTAEEIQVGSRVIITNIYENGPTVIKSDEPITIEEQYYKIPYTYNSRVEIKILSSESYKKEK